MPKYFFDDLLCSSILISFELHGENFSKIVAIFFSTLYQSRSFILKMGDIKTITFLINSVEERSHFFLERAISQVFCRLPDTKNTSHEKSKILGTQI